jgi:ribosomal protein S18 acetylase RimI-like enzyme
VPRSLRSVTIEVVPAGPERVEALADVFAASFADDPMVRWPLPADDIEAGVRTSFLAFGGGFAELGMLYEAGGGAGVAAWVPPGATERMVAMEQGTRATIAAATDDGGERYFALWDWIEEVVPDVPQWYLDLIAVAPEHRGRGVGAALIRWGVERARTDGVPAVLETARPQNVALYEHFGFRVIQEGDAPGGGPHLWFMST